MAITHIGAYSSTTQSNYFLQVYGPASFDIYETKFEATSQIAKTFDHVGNQFEDLIPASLGGGVGSKTLPTPSNHETLRIKFGRAKMYYRAKVDREAVFAGVGDGAFEDTMKVLGQRGPLTFSWNIERALWAPYLANGTSKAVEGSGILGTATAVSGTNPYTITMANDFLQGRFEIGNVVNIATDTELRATGGVGADEFEIQQVLPATSQIVVERNGGTQAPATNDIVAMQGSYANDILGIVSSAELASTDNIYTVTSAYRWAPQRKNAGGAGITVEDMDEVVLGMADTVGEGISEVFVPSLQWRKISAQLGDLKRYAMVPPRKAVEGQLGFRGLEYVHPRGTAPILISRFIPTDRIFFTNLKMAVMKHTKGFGWFRDTAGSIWFPYEEEDALQARFGGYQEFYSPPSFVGQLYNLAV